MKLNPDCIRDILLEVEKSSTRIYGLTLDTNIKNPLFDKYSWSEITYHIDQCVMSNLLTNAMVFDSDEFAEIGNLTPAGHEFIANIRQDTNWNKIKNRALKIGSIALPILQEIATKFIKEQI